MSKFVAVQFSLFEVAFFFCFFVFIFFIFRRIPFSFFQSVITSHRNFHNLSKKLDQKISRNQHVTWLALEIELKISLASLVRPLLVRPRMWSFLFLRMLDGSDPRNVFFNLMCGIEMFHFFKILRPNSSMTASSMCIHIL